MKVKRVSGVNIRRKFRRSETIEANFYRHVDWMNDIVISYSNQFNELNAMVNQDGRQISELYLRLETVEEYIEETG